MTCKGALEGFVYYWQARGPEEFRVVKELDRWITRADSWCWFTKAEGGRESDAERARCEPCGKVMKQVKVETHAWRIHHAARPRFP